MFNLFPLQRTRVNNDTTINKLKKLIHDENSDLKAVKEVIVELKKLNININTASQDGMTLVMYAFQKARYDIALELMTANAALSIVSTEGWSIMDACINEERLPQIKLLVWFDPSLLDSAASSSSKKSPSEKIKFWDNNLRSKITFYMNNKPPTPTSIIHNAIEDSKKITALLSDVQSLQQLRDELTTADYYYEIGMIYYRQLLVEKEFDRSKYAIYPRFEEKQAREDEQFRTIALKYYGSMAFEYFGLAANLYDQNMQQYDFDQKAKHIKSLNCLSLLNDFFSATNFPYHFTKEQDETLQRLKEEPNQTSSSQVPSYILSTANSSPTFHSVSAPQFDMDDSDESTPPETMQLLSKQISSSSSSSIPNSQVRHRTGRK